MSRLRSIAVTAAAAVLVLSLFVGCGNDDNGPNHGDKTAQELLLDGHKALAVFNIDGAISAYEAAYGRDPNNAPAIAYSALARLASISVDPAMSNFLKNRVGFKSYPNTYNALFKGDWLETYYDVDEGCEYWDDGYMCWTIENEVMLPGLLTPEWIKDASFFSSDAPSPETWAILLFANLLDKNTNGLNDVLDGLIDAVFGGPNSNFNVAKNRIDKLKNMGTFKLDQEFLEAIFLEDIIDHFDEIGWAELNVIVSVMTGFKGALEWITAYNWDMGDLSFFKFDWSDDEEFFDRISNIPAGNLPFNNNFLEARPGKMDVAKASFVEAVERLKASYEAILDDPKYPPIIHDYYDLVAGGTDQFVDAINNNGIFYIPEDFNGGAWPTSGNGIHLGKFFEEGFFSLGNLFEVNNDGKPVFYGVDISGLDVDVEDMEGLDLEDLSEYLVELTVDNYEELIWDFDIAFAVANIDHLTSFLVGYADFVVDEFGEQTLLPIPGPLAMMLFEKFNGIEPQAGPRPAAKAAKRIARR